MVDQLKFFWSVLKETFTEWNDSSASKDSMSLAYSAIFSIPGLLIIIIWLAGNFFGEDAVRGELSRQISSVMGSEASESIENIISASLIDKESLLMKTIGVISLVFGATTLFFQLQKSLNDLWDVKVNTEKAFLKLLLDRANSLIMILIVGTFVIATMILSSLISLFNGLISSWFGFDTYLLIQVLNFLIGFFVIMVVFALIFKILPDVEISWRSVWPGALVAALLFTIGKFLLSLYFAQVKPTSIFGTAGTVILIMMWVNYSCMLVFFGAEFTKIFSQRKGLQIKPSKHATWTYARLYRELKEE